MRISTALGGAGTGAVTALFSARVPSWWGACAVLVLAAAVLAYRLLAERGRRKTLEITYRYAPCKTVLVLGEGPGGPAMWIQVGEQPGQAASAGDQGAGITQVDGGPVKTAGTG